MVDFEFLLIILSQMFAHRTFFGNSSCDLTNYVYLCNRLGGIAQLVEHLLCKQGVKSSNLFISTSSPASRRAFLFLPL